jgi:hypothetical protein
MNDPIDWNHRQSLLHWARLAASGHEGAQAVASYHGIALPAILPPAPVVRQSPALAPQTPHPARAPRPAMSTPVQPTPALAGISRRTELLSSLLGAKPAVPTDLV